MSRPAVDGIDRSAHGMAGHLAIEYELCKLS